MTPGAAKASRRVGGRRVRIVVAALCYYPDRHTGSSRLAYDEARYLAAVGHEVWLVAMDAGAGRREYEVDGDVHVLAYRRPRWAGIGLFSGHCRAVRAVLERRVPRPVDVVHCHVPITGAAALDLYGAAARTCYSLHSPVRAELLAQRRGTTVLERARLRVAATVRGRQERRLLERCDVVTSDSDFTRRLVSEIHDPRLAGRMKVVPGWVDLSRFVILENPGEARRQLGWPLDRPVLFCLRRHVARMGIDRLIAAAGLLRSSGRSFHLVIGGTGPLRPAFEAQAKSLGLSDLVQFPGAIEDRMLPRMYEAADAFVLPSAELECFGLIAIEAMACGVPVLATPVGAIPEVVGGIEPQWLASDASAAAIASLVGDFLDGRLPRIEAKLLREHVERRYSACRRLPELAGLVLGELATQEDR
jgi:glycosyltransferase involved in cell wall biosynthesis